MNHDFKITDEADVAVRLKGLLSVSGSMALTEHFPRITPAVIRRVDELTGTGSVHRHHIEQALKDMDTGGASCGNSGS